MQRQGDMEKEHKYALKHIAQFKSRAGQLPQRQELTHVPILYPCSMTTTQVSSLWMIRFLVSRHVHWWHEKLWTYNFWKIMSALGLVVQSHQVGANCAVCHHNYQNKCVSGKEISYTASCLMAAKEIKALCFSLHPFCRYSSCSNFMHWVMECFIQSWNALPSTAD